MLQRGGGIVIEEFTGRNQVARDEVSGVFVQRGEFAADFRGKLPRFDVRRQRRPTSVGRRVGLVLGLDAASPVGTRGARRRPLTGLPPRSVLAALPVLRHVCLSTLFPFGTKIGYSQ
jgi:hypothetical protein